MGYLSEYCGQISLVMEPAYARMSLVLRTLTLLFVFWISTGLVLRAGLSDMLESPDSKKQRDYTDNRFFTKEFKTQEFSTGASSYFNTKNSGMDKSENKQFKGEFNTKNFRGASVYQTDVNPFFSTSKTFDAGGREIKGKELEFKAARESGQESHLGDKKFSQAELRYNGPELKTITKEVNIINEALKNKDDLKDQRLSIAEIREILNKKN